jgi:hypothetical protein
MAKKKREDRPPEPQPGEAPDRHPGNGTGPVYFKPRRNFAQMTLREHGAFAPALAWPLGAVESDPDEAVVQHNLEQVGAILQRLELDQVEIVRLRTETRARLARLAA